jgi:hypothetical protein
MCLTIAYEAWFVRGYSLVDNLDDREPEAQNASQMMID